MVLLRSLRPTQRTLSNILRLKLSQRSAIRLISRFNQSKLPAAYYRGGTSRGILLKLSDLPTKREDWPPIFLKLLGSPDPYGRQLDGLGGAGISSLSKICVVAPSTRDDADIDYTFFAIGIDNNEVDDSGNCGNMSSAIGPFAVEESLVELSQQDDTSEATHKVVRIFNTNTNKIIRSTFPVIKGAPVARGDYTIDGVGGSGARITLEFLSPSGAKTGHLLPTGSVIDHFCGVDTSCVDAANPCAFVAAGDLHIDGCMLPEEILANSNLVAKLETIRQQAAVAMGLCRKLEDTPRAIPKIAIVSPPKDHSVLSGARLRANDLDLVARVFSDRQPHRAIPLTGALCTAVAAQIQDSVVQRCLSNRSMDTGTFIIGHSSGRIEVSAAKNIRGEFESAIVYRTARRIMDGLVYY